MVYIPLDIVKPALQAIPTAYKGGRLAWEFYQTIRNFGRDFESSRLDFQCQEWTFASYLDQYKIWLGKEDISRRSRAELVGKKIASMVKIFNDCYEIIRQYDKAYKKEKKLQKTREGDSAVAAWGDQRNMAMVKKLVEAAEEKRSQFMLRIGEDVVVVQPAAGEASTLPAQIEKLDAEIKAAQDRITILQAVPWALHGKQKFEEKVRELKVENDALGQLIPGLVEDPFRKIRQSTVRPKLSEDVTKLRDDLEDLHQALQRANLSTHPGIDGQELILAVKVEDPHDLKTKIQGSRYVSSLLRRRHATYFLTMEVSGVGRAFPEKGLVLATTISGGDHVGIDKDLPQHIKDLSADPPTYGEIGTVSVDDSCIYHLQRIKSPSDTAIAQTASSLIGDQTFTREERVCLAAQMALGHLHFLPINRGIVVRQLGSYHVCGPQQQQQQANNNNQHWSIVTLRPLYAEFGLGRSPLVGNGEIPADEEFAQTAINPAAELGVLLYQVVAGSKLRDVATGADITMATGADIRKAQEEVSKRLKIDQTFNLYMREVVETCFLETSGDLTETIILEVAWALRHVAVPLRRPVAVQQG